MKRTILFTLAFFPLVLGLAPSLMAQNLVSYIEVQTYTASEIDQLPGGVTVLQSAEYDVVAYKVLYETLDINGSLDTASGIVAVPQEFDEEGLPVAVYQHGTTDRTDVPSDLGTTAFGAIFMASQGYLGVGPDLLGLGESRGFHPYIHAATEASAAWDMLLACDEMAAELDLPLNRQLVITGYSQGGHSSMALHKWIEEQEETQWDLIACAHLSGPYSVSDIMRKRIIDSLDYSPGIAFLPYVVLAYREVYGDEELNIENVFKPQYHTVIQSFFDGNTDLETMAFSLGASLLFATGGLNPRDLLTDQVANLLETEQPENHPILTALRDNDLLDWQATTPTRLYYCEADEQVPYTNSLQAENGMIENGSIDVVAESVGAELDHGDCFFPAMASAVSFFEASIITSIDLINKPSSSIRCYPNPSDNYLTVDWDSGMAISSLYIRDMQGRAVHQQAVSDIGGATHIDVSHMKSGVYLLEVANQHQRWIQKVIIHTD